MSKMKKYRVRVYITVPVETVVRTTSMKKAKQIASERDGPDIAAYFQAQEDTDWVWGTIYDSPGEKVDDPETEVEDEG